MRAISQGTATARWSSRLLCVLLEELYVDEEITDFVGDPRRLPVARYPQALIVALALRHSWRPDDFQRLLKRLGIRLASRS